MSKIKLLSEATIERIAAGEIAERPSAILKELIENSLDSGANQITIKLENAGLNLLEVIDNGSGIAKEDLLLAVTRHATSKLPEEDLFNIRTFGFRGEALAAISSVSDFSLISTTARQQNCGYQIKVYHGKIGEIAEVSANKGTTIRVQDLFKMIPARLKFLRSLNSEFNNCLEVVERFALVHHDCRFQLWHNGKKSLDLWPSNLQERLDQILDKNFSRNSVEIKYEDPIIKIYGHSSIPSYNKNTGQKQLFFVNKRYIKDKNLLAAARAAYSDSLAKDRYPVMALFIYVDPNFLDVNVHPNKTEVRFQDLPLVRSCMIKALTSRIAISPSSLEQANLLLHKTAENFNLPENPIEAKIPSISSNILTKNIRLSNLSNLDLKENLAAVTSINTATVQEIFDSAASPLSEQSNFSKNSDSKFLDLGKAIGQIGNLFILAENSEGLVIIDQHAAHERILYQKFKNQEFKETQMLVSPLRITFPGAKIPLIRDAFAILQKNGVILEEMGNNLILTGIHPLIKDLDLGDFLQSLLDEPELLTTNLRDKFWEKLSTKACKNSVKAGDALSLTEIDHLLREMEKTLWIAECNHGRPTYVVFSWTKLGNLFGRRLN